MTRDLPKPAPTRAGARPASAALVVLALLAPARLAAAPAPESAPALPRLAVEPAAVALARLDSLMAIVQAEEVRTREALGVEINWDRLARAWFQVGDHAKAARCLERARALGAREFDTMLLSGRVARSEGRFGEAVEWLQRAVRLRPEDWEAHEDLGLALYLDGRHAAAADHWERSRALPGSGSPDRTGLIAALRRTGERSYRVGGRGRERLRFASHDAYRAPIIPVSVNGRGPYLFRIDTGSPEVVLGRSLAEELEVAILEGGLAAGERAVRFDYAVLDSLTLGETEIHRLPVAVSDHSGLAGNAGVRGLLGFEVLRRFRFCLDFPDSALWLEPLAAVSTPADTAPPPWALAGTATRMPVLLRGTHLLIAYGRLNRGPARPFLLDAASPGVPLAAAASTLAEAGIALDTTRVLTGSSAGGAVGYIGFPVDRLCLGEVCRDSLDGAYGPFPARLETNPSFRLAGLVSGGFLSRFRFGVDLARGELWLVRP